jgi:hypothetical protein
MNSRNAGMLAGIALAVTMIAPVAHGQQAHVEKIPLQHIDVRTVAALLGAPVMPNELEAAQQRSRGGGLTPGTGYGGGYGARSGAAPYGSGYSRNRLMPSYPRNAVSPGYSSALPRGANSRAPWFAQRSVATVAPQPFVVADPRTNSLITGR